MYMNTIKPIPALEMNTAYLIAWSASEVGFGTVLGKQAAENLADLVRNCLHLEETGKLFIFQHCPTNKAICQHQDTGSQ